jgi:hypothetical protein
MDSRLRGSDGLGVFYVFLIIGDPIMPDPYPASRIVTLRKITGFRVKPGMTKTCLGISLNYHNYLKLSKLKIKIIQTPL